MSKSTPRVVVGTDGSPASRAALGWAADAAARQGADLEVMHACALPDGHDPSVQLRCGTSAPAAGRAQLERAAAWASEGQPDVDIKTVAVTGSAARALIYRSGSAALLVVGGRQCHQPVTLGSVSHQCAEYASCPVVLVPDTWLAKRRCRRVIVGIDGSPSSYDALRWAVRAADERAVALSVVHAIQDPRACPLGPAATESDELLELMTTTVGVQDRSEVERLTRLAPAADELCALAGPDDLLVVGVRGRGGFPALRLGSVTQKCLLHARGPLAIVRHNTQPQ